MNEHPPHAEPRDLGAALDANGGLDVAGPTARQELLLRRQHLWTDDLTREQASSIIGDFLACKHAERRLNRETGNTPHAEIY